LPGQFLVPLIPRFLLAIVAVLLTLFVLEIAFRVKAATDQRRLSTSLSTLGRKPTVPAGANVGLRDIIRFSRNPRLIYELIPDVEVVFHGKLLTTDTRGFRRTPGSVTGAGVHAKRIVGVGDSFMFGWGVADNECYLARLAAQLNHDQSKYTWEVINMSVPGYNTAMEIEMLKTKSLDAGIVPTIVVVHFVINDLDLPNFIRRKDRWFSLNRSFLWESLSSDFGRRYEGFERLEDTAFNPLERRFEHDVKNVPAEYKDLVGMAAFNGSMEQLKNLSVRHGFSVFVLCDFTAPRYVKETCSRLGFQLIETQARVMAYMRRYLGKENMSLDDYFHSPLVLSPKDTHPSAEGHALIAAALLAGLESLGESEPATNSAALGR